MKGLGAALGRDPSGSADTVAGERGVAIVAQPASLQSRVSHLLALTLIVALGLAFLAWYYSHTALRRSRGRQSAQAQLTSRAQAEMPLPALGPLPSAAAVEALAPVEPPAAPVAVAVTSPSTVQPPDATPRPSALERRLSGSAFSTASAATGAEAGVPVSVTDRSAATVAGAPNGLGALLHADPAVAGHAHVLASRRWLLPKGAFLDCTLETAIDSTLPGLTTCVTATDTFGADGTVVLLDRGTKLIGETRGQVQQGAARVFVLWSEARTPTGVVVPLDSPGADELGRSGLPGVVERHFWQRFGAAILISTIDGAVQASVQAAGRGGGAVIYSPSGSEDVMTEVLKGTVNIAPTVIKNNGDRIQVLVARDLDFTNVYELRRVGSGF
ncbi:MAG TPA: type IV secretion system protein VirB10 [Steroidobacteraceae bacterium]|jgi:type IV secretion system protein VirB10